MTMSTGDAQAPTPTHDDPAPPLPHADPAPASGELAGPLIDKARRLEACNVADIDPARVAGTGTEIPVAAATAMRDRLVAQDARIAELESAMLDGAILSGLNYMRERDAALTRAEAAEAECDRLGVEVAALRGAMPDPGDLDAAAVVLEGSAEVSTRKRHDLAAKLLRCSEAIDAALATATPTPTPQAAEAVTGGWTREAQRGQSGLYWLLISGGDRPRLLDVFWPSDGPIVAGLGAPMPGDVLLWGPPFTDDPPPGWREALAALDQDQPQEADHAR